MGQDGFGDIQACSMKLHNFKDYSLLQGIGKHHLNESNNNHQTTLEKYTKWQTFRKIKHSAV